MYFNYAKYIMQINTYIRKPTKMDKICYDFSICTLFLIIFLFEDIETCFILISRKIAAVLLKINCLKNPR